VAEVEADQYAVVLGSIIISSDEINTGDVLSIYTVDGRMLGQAGILNVATVFTPPLDPNTPDPAFGTTFAGYSYLRVTLSPSCPRTVPILKCHVQGW
jgi:hypothetical protein